MLKQGKSPALCQVAKENQPGLKTVTTSREVFPIQLFIYSASNHWVSDAMQISALLELIFLGLWKGDRGNK